jgi:hypothetical protein
MGVYSNANSNTEGTEFAEIGESQRAEILRPQRRQGPLPRLLDISKSCRTVRLGCTALPTMHDTGIPFNWLAG